MQLTQVKYLNDMAEAFQNRSKSVHLRKEILQKQDQRNYRSEYERIRNHVENSATPALTKDHIKDRQAHLKKLGARAVDNITWAPTIFIKKLVATLQHMKLNKAQMHQRPTYETLVRDTILEPKDKIAFPDRTATILRKTQQLTRYDDAAVWGVP